MEKSVEFYSLEKGILALKDQIDALAETDDIDKKDKIAALRGRDREGMGQDRAPAAPPSTSSRSPATPSAPTPSTISPSCFQDFMEMHGDRRFADDPAIVAGLAFYKGRTVAVIGHQKGRTTRARIDRNFGQPNPEGYRKALRVMQEAEKFGFPVITFIDTPGRLSRHRGRGARPGRGHRQQPEGHRPAAASRSSTSSSAKAAAAAAWASASATSS